MNKVFKSIIFSLPLFLYIGCSSDDNVDDYELNSKPDCVPFEYEGVVDSHTKIKVPAAGGEYELRSANNLRPQVSYFDINVKDSTNKETLTYRAFSGGKIRYKDDGSYTVDTVYPALVTDTDTTVTKWISVEENRKEGIYKVSVAENDGNPRFVTIYLGNDLIAGSINLKQAGK